MGGDVFKVTVFLVANLILSFIYRVISMTECWAPIFFWLMLSTCTGIEIGEREVMWFVNVFASELRIHPLRLAQLHLPPLMCVCV